MPASFNSGLGQCRGQACDMHREKDEESQFGKYCRNMRRKVIL